MKKMLAVILMAAMMVSTFSGCSGNGSGETEESENSTTASVESSEEASEETSGETVTYVLRITSDRFCCIPENIRFGFTCFLRLLQNNGQEQ